MKALTIAFRTELTKTLKSKMLWATLIFFGFIGLMLSFLMLVARHPEIAGKSEVLNIKASMISSPTWPTYYLLLIQMVLTIGSIGSAIVAIWIFGREYADHVIKDILALPVSRTSIVTAKFIILFFWSFILLMLLYGFSIISGLIINLDGWDKVLFQQKTLAYTISALLTILLSPVIALITCIARGYLLPVGISILILIATQFVFLGLPGIIPFFPWAIPGLFSGVAGPGAAKPEIISLIVLAMTSLAGIIGTAAWWRYADHH